jgi:predicted transcriptional regulator
MTFAPPLLRRRSLASLVLARRGVSLAQVGEALGVSTSAVSMQLARRRRPHPSLLAVVRALAGNEAAEEIAALLDEGAQR